MGLGKTIQASMFILHLLIHLAAIAYYYKEDWPALIICPSSLRYNWSNELERWLLPDLKSEDINIITGGKQELTGRVDIVTYDLASRMTEKIAAKNYKVVIVDESHYLKNPKTKRATNIVPFVQVRILFN
jgi:SWI/SNF-related matrix-associated actin-dependent regulator 1 of chromatin subfamily A